MNSLHADMYYDETDKWVATAYFINPSKVIIHKPQFWCVFFNLLVKAIKTCCYRDYGANDSAQPMMLISVIQTRYRTMAHISQGGLKFQNLLTALFVT